jgi:hypothetical protein
LAENEKDGAGWDVAVIFTFPVLFVVTSDWDVVWSWIEVVLEVVDEDSEVGSEEVREEAEGIEIDSVFISSITAIFPSFQT